MKLKIILVGIFIISNAAAAESSNLIIETDASVTTPASQNNIALVSSTPNAQKTKASKRKKQAAHKRKVYSNIEDMNFDFAFSGNLPDALKLLQQYDYTLKILPSLGKKQNVGLAIDLQNTNLDELLTTLNAQADGYASVQYNPKNNSIKIIYSSKIRDIGYDAMMESKKWKDGHKPKPIITPDGVLQYPYGFYQPVIPCRIGMICDIRLGAGEVLMDWAISDIGNWQMYSKNNGRDGSGTEPSLAFSGSGNNVIPHILIKPTAAATTTNLVVLTNKRTYDMLLKATNSDYVLAAGFYFPNQLMQSVADEKQQLRNNADKSDSPRSDDPDFTDAYNINMSNLRYDDYEVSGDDVAWKPTAIIDDGERVWIKFADSNQISPILVETDPDNPSQPYKMIRYFPQAGGMYLVNRMFDEAMLIKGINDQTKVIYIKRKKAEKSFFRKIFG